MMYCQYIIFPLLGILNNVSASLKKKNYLYWLLWVFIAA